MTAGLSGKSDLADLSGIRFHRPRIVPAPSVRNDPAGIRKPQDIPIWLMLPAVVMVKSSMRRNRPSSVWKVFSRAGKRGKIDGNLNIV
jgi:hypothetical protein